MKRFFFLILLFFSAKSLAQDPVFTQFYNIPDYLNPSFTGFSKGTKVGIINRTQWFGLNYGLNSQFFFIDNYFGNDAETGIGLGLNIMNHHESVTRYNFTQVNLNYAHHLKISNEWYFNPSLTVGIGVKDYSFDYLLEDQILIFQGIINANSNDPVLFYSRGIAKLMSGDKKGGCIDLKRGFSVLTKEEKQELKNLCN